MRCRKYTSSCRCRRPSIHPQHSAVSITSGMVTVATPVPFFAIFSQTPGDEAWCFANHLSHASAEASSITGRSGTCSAMAPLSRVHASEAGRRTPLAFPRPAAHRAADVHRGRGHLRRRAARRLPPHPRRHRPRDRRNGVGPRPRRHPRVGRPRRRRHLDRTAGGADHRGHDRRRHHLASGRCRCSRPAGSCGSSTSPTASASPTARCPRTRRRVRSASW